MPGEKDFAIELGNKGADKATVAVADETKDATEDDSLWLFFCLC